MIKSTIIELFERDLDKLAAELNAYSKEQDLWITMPQINNSAGNLCLHLVGNLNHFIGTILGNTAYVRDREAEFSLKEVPLAHMLNAIASTKIMLRTTLESLSDVTFQSDFPIPKHGQTVSTNYMLLHLLTHFSYHLGQINYHRRLLSPPPTITTC